MWSSRLLLMIVLGVALVLLAFLTVLGGGWWGVAGAVIVLLAVAALVVRAVLSMLSDVDAPSATERARLEEQGVRDPDRELNERQTSGDDGPVRRLFTEDSGDAASTEEQQSAWTPAPSRRVDEKTS